MVFVFLQRVGEPDRAKRMKEDSLLLLRGFDSISQNLSQLSNNLDNALQVDGNSFYSFKTCLL